MSLENHIKKESLSSQNKTLKVGILVMTFVVGYFGYLLNDRSQSPNFQIAEKQRLLEEHYPLSYIRTVIAGDLYLWFDYNSHNVLEQVEIIAQRLSQRLYREKYEDIKKTALLLSKNKGFYQSLKSLKSIVKEDGHTFKIKAYLEQKDPKGTLVREEIDVILEYTFDVATGLPYIDSLNYFNKDEYRKMEDDKKKLRAKKNEKNN